MEPSEWLARCATALPEFGHSDAYLESLIVQRGELEAANLRADAHDGAWLEGLSQLRVPHPAKAAGWALGFGSATADFLAAPLDPDPASVPAIRATGARVNLIVTLYDHLLDSGKKPDDNPLIPALIGGFYAGVPATPLLHRAIRRMYEAERGGAHSRRDWVRKSALPFVTTGLAVAILAQRELPRGYLAWLYRVGIWIGWIDDARDLDRDRAAGYANRFAADVPPASPEPLILSWWRARSRREEVAEPFLYCVKAWLAPKHK